jgi:tRNA 2-thiouridine synthesizing protein A
MVEKLDCMGDFCPVPALKVRSRLSGLKAGDGLIVLLDHSCAVENIRELVYNQNIKMEVEEVATGIWQVTLVKAG